MKKLNLIGWALLSLAMTVALSSCEEDDNPPPSGDYSDGVFIVNEGNSSSGGSISYYSYQGDTVSNNIFQTVNERPLGTIVQSLTEIDDKAYIVVNGSNKIEVADKHSFKELTSITGLESPRYITAVTDEKAYVTQWGNGGQIKVVDLNNNEIVKTIDAGAGPEKIYTYYNKIFVANGGGLSVDSTVFVIDASRDLVVDTIQVGYNPKDMVMDTDGNLWVLCYGYVQYDENWTVTAESPSELYKINSINHTIIDSYTISNNKHPEHLEISPDGNSIYYGGGFLFGNIYKMNIYDSELPANPFNDNYFYGFNVDWTDGTIFALEAPDFTSNGLLHRIDAEGTVLGNYEVGIGPNGIGMKKKK